MLFLFFIIILNSSNDNTARRDNSIQNVSLVGTYKHNGFTKGEV